MQARIVVLAALMCCLPGAQAIELSWSVPEPDAREEGDLFFQVDYDCDELGGSGPWHVTLNQTTMREAIAIGFDILTIDGPCDGGLAQVNGTGTYAWGDSLPPDRFPCAHIAATLTDNAGSIQNTTVQEICLATPFRGALTIQELDRSPIRDGLHLQLLITNESDVELRVSTHHNNVTFEGDPRGYVEITGETHMLLAPGSREVGIDVAGPRGAWDSLDMEVVILGQHWAGALEARLPLHIDRADTDASLGIWFTLGLLASAAAMIAVFVKVARRSS